MCQCYKYYISQAPSSNQLSCKQCHQKAKFLKLLSPLVCNPESIKTLEVPANGKLNIHMGIGLWSQNNGLSSGLPIDVMGMLQVLILMRKLFKLEYPHEKCEFVILIADSLAEKAGANKKELNERVKEYKDILTALLELLNMKDHSQILLSSIVMKTDEYKLIENTLEGKGLMKGLKNDGEHYHYILGQLAMTEYLYTYYGVGIKVGWMCNTKNPKPSSSITPSGQKKWDEPEFDGLYAQAYQNEMKYLYCKAGLKLHSKSKQVNFVECCPYTCYPHEGGRFLLKNNLPTKLKLYRTVTKRWEEMLKVWSELLKENVINPEAYPIYCVKPLNLKASVTNFLKYWTMKARENSVQM